MKTQPRKIYASDYTGDDSIPAFIAFAIEQFKHHRHLTGREAMEILSEGGVLERLEEYYDVYHTQGVQWLMEEIDHILASQH